MKKNKSAFSKNLFIFITLLVIFQSNARAQSNDSSEAIQIPNVDGLKAQIQAFYEGEKNKNGKTFFKLTHPSLHRGKTIDQAPEVFPWNYDLIDWQILSIENMPIPKKPNITFTSAARVSMDVTIRTKEGKIEKPKDQTDYWVCEKGTWYWTWRGWPAD
jgi:hypothetical protein